MPTKAERLKEFAAVAVKVGKAKNYPPELLVAQWAIESGWGEKESGTNNYFGMTRAKRHGASWKWVPTREVLSAAGIAKLDVDERARITSQTVRTDGKFDVRLSRRFASYPTLQAGVEDKIWLIQSGAPYKKFFDAYLIDNDLNKLIDGFAPIYATDPSYGTLAKTIAAQANVRSAIAAAQV